MNQKVNAFLKEAGRWREEMTALRKILLVCGLAEEVKWSKPCYSFQENNVVVIQGFKAYCALLFFKGVLMKDPEGILVKTGPNTRVGRQVRFTSVYEIEKLKSVLKAYIKQAIDLEKAGRKVELKDDEGITIPGEFQKKLREDAALKAAFEALTPGRQRGYIFHFSQPKQSKTREARIEKCIPLIFDRMGLFDEYQAAKKKK